MQRCDTHDAQVHGPTCEGRKQRLMALADDERVAAMRAGRPSYCELAHWSAARPGELPLVGTGEGGSDEFEWIAMLEPDMAEHDERRLNGDRARVTVAQWRPRAVARVALTGITIAIGGTAQQCSTTIATVGGYAVIVASALPGIGITLPSSYLSAMIGEIAASHLAIVPVAGRSSTSTSCRVRECSAC